MKAIFLSCLLFVGITAEVISLPGYNVDVHGTTVGGLSAGGFFSVQMHVAYSDIIKGAAIFAGGPYHCAEGQLMQAMTTCMTASPSAPDPSRLVSLTHDIASKGLIADLGNLVNSTVYLFSGTLDQTVKPTVMKSLNTYYQSVLKGGKQVFVDHMAAAHTHPTDDPSMNSCTASASPYISNCKYDGAGEALKVLYGSLNARNDGPLNGSIIEFDQSEFIDNPNSKSMRKTGFAYVPAACARGELCRLHVQFHGCQQYYDKIGNAYVTKTGYNKWADTNNIIVLYPQTIASTFNPQNPNGCFDWWGYNGAPTHYDTQKGIQMSGVRAMISRIGSKFNPLPAPTGLKVTGVTDDSISLAWAAVDKAAGYVVRVDGSVYTNNPIPTTYTTVIDLQPGTTYTFDVSAVTASGSQGAASAPVSGTTSGDPPPIAPPTGLATQLVTSDTVDLVWNTVAGAIGYNVYRNHSRVTPSPVPIASFTDTGLTPLTTFAYTVTSVGAAGESAPSKPLEVHTKSAWECKQTTDNNYNHVGANRAYQTAGSVYAVGSRQHMGLYNVFTITTLAETFEGFWIVGSCP